MCVCVCVCVCVCGCGCDLLLSWRTKQETGSGSLLPVQVRQRVDRLAGRTAAATAQPHTQTTTSHEFSIDAQASTGAGAGAGAGGGEPSGDLAGQHWLVRVSAVVDRLVVTKTADRVRAIADTLKRYAARDDQRALWPHICAVCDLCGLPQVGRICRGGQAALVQRRCGFGTGHRGTGGKGCDWQAQASAGQRSGTHSGGNTASIRRTRYAMMARAMHGRTPAALHKWKRCQ